MEKEKLTREINELIIKICEYYGVLGNEQNTIYKKALLDLLNEFNEKDDNYDLTKQVEKYEEEIEKLQEKIEDYEYEIEHAQNSLKNKKD